MFNFSNQLKSCLNLTGGERLNALCELREQVEIHRHDALEEANWLDYLSQNSEEILLSYSSIDDFEDNLSKARAICSNRERELVTIQEILIALE